MTITWQKKVLALQSRGWSLSAIGREVGTSVSAVSDLKHGRTKEPRASVAFELQRVYSSRQRPPAKNRKQQ